MGGNRQLQQCASAAEPAAVDTRAGGILCEAALGGGYVPVDLPAAGAVVAPPAVLNESHNVLHRITEEDADLMGKFGGKAQPSGKLFQKRRRTRRPGNSRTAEESAGSPGRFRRQCSACSR